MRFLVLVSICYGLLTCAAFSQTHAEFLQYSAMSYADLEVKAEKGDVKAMLDLARKCISNRNDERAVEWFERASEAGNYDAKASLFVFYSEGRGCKKDTEKAMKLLEESVINGSPIGMHALGILYRYGNFGFPVDMIKAIEWISKSVKAGYGLAAIDLGQIYYWGEAGVTDYKEAIRWLEYGASLGYPQCYTDIGFAYQFVLLQKDYDKALFYYTKGVEPCGQGHLGAFYYCGPEKYRNYELAIKYLEQSAKLGGYFGLYLLADMKKKGRGMEKDIEGSLTLAAEADKMGSENDKHLLEMILNFAKLEYRFD